MCAVGSRPTVAKRSILDTQSLTSSKRNGTRNTKESCSTSQERAMAEVSGGTETAPGLAAWLQCVSHHHGHHKTYSRHRSRKVSGNSVFSFGRGRPQRVKKHITCACTFLQIRSPSQHPFRLHRPHRMRQLHQCWSGVVFIFTRCHLRRKRLIDQCLVRELLHTRFSADLAPWML